MKPDDYIVDQLTRWGEDNKKSSQKNPYSQNRMAVKKITVKDPASEVEKLKELNQNNITSYIRGE